MTSLRVTDRGPDDAMGRAPPDTALYRARKRAATVCVPRTRSWRRPSWRDALTAFAGCYDETATRELSRLIEIAPPLQRDVSGIRFWKTASLVARHSSS